MGFDYPLAAYCGKFSQNKKLQHYQEICIQLNINIAQVMKGLFDVILVDLIFISKVVKGTVFYSSMKYHISFSEKHNMHICPLKQKLPRDLKWNNGFLVFIHE